MFDSPELEYTPSISQNNFHSSCVSAFWLRGSGCGVFYVRLVLLFPASEARLYVRLVRRCASDALAAGTAAAHAHVVKRFSENGCFMEAEELCQDMHGVGMAMDVVALRVVASVTATLGMFEFASNIHVYALKVGLDTDCFVVSELIKSAGRRGAKHAGEQIHGNLVKIGSEYLDVIVGNVLIDLYVKTAAMMKPFNFSLRCSTVDCMQITSPLLESYGDVLTYECAADPVLGPGQEETLKRLYQEMGSNIITKKVAIQSKCMQAALLKKLGCSHWTKRKVMKLFLMLGRSTLTLLLNSLDLRFPSMWLDMNLMGSIL
ncbi:hypothetical protein EJB05_36671, partial [Eragrostis curvula]